MEEIFVEIAEERGRQDFKWGGPGHDDEHDQDDWSRFIDKHLRKATPSFRFDRELFRKQMVRVAALALAAIEWVDRK
jgi:hypothetical protein